MKRGNPGIVIRRAAWLAVTIAILRVAPARAGATDPRDLRIPEPFAVQGTAALDSIVFKTVLTTNNLVGTTLTNYGFMGNNFTARSASLEYPAGSGYEHMVRGGLWVGAHSTFGGAEFDGVATGTIDGATNNASQGATEFTPAGNEFTRRSILITDPFYSTAARSEQDIISSFSDFPQKRAASNQEDSHPMGLLITQSNYSWSFSDFANILFYHYEIKNTGPLLTNVWVGFYAEFASGNKGAYTNWAPSSTDPSGTGGWFNKKQIAYEDSLRLLREHYCASLPIPDGCQYGRAPYWIGLRLLGTKGLTEDTTTRKTTLAAWSWSPSSPYRAYDAQRYAIMSAGTIQPIAGDSLQPQTGDPVTLLAAGPFPRIYTDSTVTVDFAILGAPDVPPLEHRSRVAQKAYDLNYIVPIPPPSPRIHMIAHDNSLEYFWDRSPEFKGDPTSIPDTLDFEGYRLYVGEARDKLIQVAQFDSDVSLGDTTGFNTGFRGVEIRNPSNSGPDSVKFGNTWFRYHYTLRGLRNGFKYYTAITAYDRGNNLIESLESGVTQNLTLAVPGPTEKERTSVGPTVFPNPYRVEAAWDQGRKVRDHYLWFTRLPASCTLKIFTLSGDLIYEKKFDGSTYQGDNARGLYSPQQDAPLAPPTLSGTTFAWDLITKQGQAAATGLYLFSVEDGSGNRTIGKFLIIKSDRE